MAIAIDRELAGDIRNPSFDVINYCIEEHEKELPRLQMLFDYYDGKPHKEGKEASKTPHELDEIYVNLAKYVTDLMTGFSVGNPLSYTVPKGEDITVLTDALARMKIAKHDIELEKGLSAMGQGLELHYLAVDEKTDETYPKVAWIDPRGMFLVVDDNVERTPLFAVRPRKKQDLSRTEYWEITVYTKNHQITYKSKNKKLEPGQLMETPKTKEHFFGDVPVVEFRNNEEKQGDYEQNLSQIDGYNLLQTDRIKDKQNFVKAMMVLYGFTLPDKKPKTMNGSIILQAPSQGGEEGAKVEYVTKTFDETQIQVLADSILDDFHKTTYVPNLNDENFAGTQSGQAMKFKLLGLLLALSVKTSYFEDGVIRRLRLIGNILTVKGQKVDTDRINVRFKINLPFDRKDVIDQIRDSQEFVPLLVSLGWLDDVDNPKELLDMLREQQEENIERQAKLLGIQADRSHSELEEGENEDDSSNLQEKE